MFIPRIASQHLKNWNREAYDYDSILELILKEGITFIETDLIGRWGAYIIYKGVHFIIVRPDVPRQYRTWVLAHEFGHYLLHTPGGFARSKQDFEADIVAAIAIIPLATIDRVDLSEYPPELVQRRYEIYEQYRL